MKLRPERFISKPDGTYDRQTAERIDHADGYSVSMHQNEADDHGWFKSHTGAYKSVKEYQTKMMAIAEEYGLEINVGVFHHEAEVSFWTKDENVARIIAEKYNQYAYYDHKKKCFVKNPKYNPKQNPMPKE